MGSPIENVCWPFQKVNKRLSDCGLCLFVTPCPRFHKVLYRLYTYTCWVCAVPLQSATAPKSWRIICVVVSYFTRRPRAANFPAAWLLLLLLTLGCYVFFFEIYVTWFFFFSYLFSNTSNHSTKKKEVDPILETVFLFSRPRQLFSEWTIIPSLSHAILSAILFILSFLFFCVFFHLVRTKEKTEQGKKKKTR